MRGNPGTMSAALLRSMLLEAQTIGQMADTSLLANKRPELSKMLRQARVLLVVVGSSSTNLRAADPAAKQHLRNLTMGD